MAPKELSESEFQATFAPPMVAIDDPEEVTPIDMADYVSECIAELQLPTNWEDIEIHYVYRTADLRYTHMLFNYGEANVFLVVVVDEASARLLGHHVLNLNEKYGLDDQA